jgi:hypothetical protein
MFEKIIFVILKVQSKPEQERILREMVFQLLPKKHISKNPTRSKRVNFKLNDGTTIITSEIDEEEDRREGKEYRDELAAEEKRLRE